MSAMNGGQDEREIKAPGFHQIWAHLSIIYKAIFDKPAMAMQQQLRVGDGILLDESQWVHLCMRMNEEVCRACTSAVILKLTLTISFAERCICSLHCTFSETTRSYKHFKGKL